MEARGLCTGYLSLKSLCLPFSVPTLLQDCHSDAAQRPRPLGTPIWPYDHPSPGATSDVLGTKCERADEMTQEARKHTTEIKSCYGYVLGRKHGSNKSPGRTHRLQRRQDHPETHFRKPQGNVARSTPSPPPYVY